MILGGISGEFAQIPESQDFEPERAMSNKRAVALFTRTKTWKQPKWPSTEEWIKKMWYIYTVEYYSAIRKNEIMPFAATWMDFRDYHTK